MRGLLARTALVGQLRNAGWPLAVSYGGVLLVRALIPAASAVTMAVLVGVLERRLAVTGLFGRAAVPLALFAGVLLLGHLIDAATGPLRYAVACRIDGAHRATVARLAASAPTLDVLELPRTRDLLRVAAADPRNWSERTPGDGATGQLAIVIEYAGLASSCIVLWAFSPWLVPAILLPGLLRRAVYRRRILGHFQQWIRQMEHGRRCDYWKQVATSAAEGKELRIFGFGRWAADRGQRHLHAMFDPVWALQRADAVTASWITAVLCGIPLAVSYGLVAAGTAGGHHSVAAETAVLGAGWSVYVMLGSLYRVRQVEGALPCLQALRDLRAVLDTGTGAGSSADSEAGLPVSDTGNVTKEPRLVRFSGVRFSYPGTGRQVLEDLNLDIRPGELLAIVGLNGAGKSTLIKLLSGLYRPAEGTITVGGADIFADLAGWRRQVSVVFQDFGKYELSLRENITLGDASPAVLDAVAAEAGLDEVLSELPGGWDTPLARTRTGGVDLSGGQWQQVVLARALYAMAAGAWLMILDEPTAHLDVRTEFELFSRLARRAGDASVVLISHRLSTVRQADRIVLLDAGRITETGTHDELIARGGKYAAMFALQAERFARGYEDRIEEGA